MDAELTRNIAHLPCMTKVMGDKSAQNPDYLNNSAA